MNKPGRVEAILLAGALALLAVACVGDRFWMQLLGKAMITCIFAISLDLLVGYAGLVSLAHAAFFGLSAYALVGLTNRFELVNPLLTLPLALLCAALAALCIGWLSLRAAGVYFIMVTLAFTQMLFYLFSEAPWFGGSDGLYLSQKPLLSLFGKPVLDLSNRTAAYLCIFAALVLTYLLLQRLLRAPFGRVLRGIHGNEQRTRALGFATSRYKLVAFVIAGTVAGFAGYLDAALYGFVNPAELGWRQSGLLLMMVLLGGRGTLYGPILGAFLLTFLEHYGASATDHYNALVGGVVILVVLFLPRGVAGLVERGARG